MRTESCRRCGVEQIIKQKCSVCSKPLKFGCQKCSTVSDEQIHTQCRLDMSKPIFSEVA